MSLLTLLLNTLEVTRYLQLYIDKYIPQARGLGK